MPLEVPFDTEKGLLKVRNTGIIWLLRQWINLGEPLPITVSHGESLQIAVYY